MPIFTSSGGGGSSGGGTWGSITGTLSNQTDLQAALDAKQDAGAGGAAWGSITGTLSSQTDLQTALNAKQASGNYLKYDGTNSPSAAIDWNYKALSNVGSLVITDGLTPGDYSTFSYTNSSKTLLIKATAGARKLIMTYGTYGNAFVSDQTNGYAYIGWPNSDCNFSVGSQGIGNAKSRDFIIFGDGSGETHNANILFFDASSGVGNNPDGANAAYYRPAWVNANDVVAARYVRTASFTTTAKNALSSPPTGAIVFDSTLGKLCVYTGAAWQTITST